MSAAVAFGLAILLAADAGAPSALPPQPLIRPAQGWPAARERTYSLVPARDGTGELVYEALGFTARVARDGAARFVDKGARLARGWSIFPFAPLPLPPGTPSLQGVMVDLFGRRRPPPPRLPARDEPPYEPSAPLPDPTRYRPDPREACRPPRACAFQAAPLVSVTGTYDLTDELMRMNGQDPYRYEKALFLATTREQRAGMAARAAATDARRAAEALAATLETLACDGRRSVAERRAIIEGLGRELDGETPAAREAAATVARFLAARFATADAGAAGAADPCPQR